MLNVVSVETHPEIDLEKIVFKTDTEPERTFTCDYEAGDVFITFMFENLSLYEELQIAKGLLNSNSNFAKVLKESFTKQRGKTGKRFKGVNCIYLVSQNWYSMNEVFPVERNSDIEEMVRASCRNYGFFVLDDDLEKDILDRKNNIYTVEQRIYELFEEEIAYPLRNEEMKRIIFLSEQEKHDYYLAFDKQMKPERKKYLLNFKLHEKSSEKSKIYLDLVKAKCQEDMEAVEKYARLIKTFN